MLKIEFALFFFRRRRRDIIYNTRAAFYKMGRGCIEDGLAGQELNDPRAAFHFHRLARSRYIISR